MTTAEFPPSSSSSLRTKSIAKLTLETLHFSAFRKAFTLLFSVSGRKHIPVDKSETEESSVSSSLLCSYVMLL